jgi:predicted Ser/Thr protein kinase
MNDSEENCPQCGQPLPNDAPEGLCPSCSLQMALAAGGLDFDGMDSENPSSERTTELQQPFGAGDVLLERDSRIVTKWGRWIALFFLGGITIAFGLHQIIVATQNRPSIIFNAERLPVFESGQLGLSPDHQLTAINGEATPTMGVVNDVFSEVEDEFMELEFSAQEDDISNIFWLHVEPPLGVEIDHERNVVLRDSGEELAAFIEPHEKIIAINGVLITDIQPNVDGDFDVPLADADITQFLRLTVSSELDNNTREIIAHEYAKSRMWILYLAGIALLGIGLWTYWLRPNRKSAFGFFIYCSTIGIYNFARSVPIWHRNDVENFIYVFFQCFVVSSFCIFILTFTLLRTLLKKNNTWIIISLFLGPILATASYMTYPKLGAYGLLGYPLFQAWGLILLVLFLLSSLIDIGMRIFRITLNPTDRQRAHVLRIAMVAGFGPSIFYTFTIAFLVPGNLADYVFIVNATLLLFPIIIAYAIVRQNFLRLNELVMEGLIYGVLVFGVTAIYAAGVFALVPLISLLIPNSDPQIQMFVLAGSFVIALPLQNMTRKTIERRWRTSTLDFDSFLADSDKTWNSAQDYCDAAAAQLTEMLKTSHVAIFSHSVPRSQWTLAALVPDSDKETTLDVCQGLLASIEGDEHIIFRDDIYEDVRLRHSRKTLLRAFRILNAAMIVPLRVQEDLVGAIVVGYKADESNYSNQDIQTLRKITNQIAQMLKAWQAQGDLSHSKRIADSWPDIPEKIGSYEIKGHLGEGGMGYVFLGVRQGEHVAIKVAKRMVQDNATFMERFHREASAIQRIQHPNVVRTIEIGWEGSEPYIAFEYCSGGSLAVWISQREAVSVPDALAAVAEIARGLQAAQKNGVIHRDIKPNNIFRSGNGEIKIGDFGLARILDRSTLTIDGQLFGTPSYMAPEVLRGESASIQSDQYSVGVTLYEVLTKKLPFGGESVHSSVYQRLNFDPPDPRTIRGDLEKPVAELCMRLLAPEPENRFETYEEMLHEIESASGVMQGLKSAERDDHD